MYCMFLYMWEQCTDCKRFCELSSSVSAARWTKAVSLGKQGQWTHWESVEGRRITWKELWSMEAKRISFIIRAAYDVLPASSNLHQWFGEDPG